MFQCPRWPAKVDQCFGLQHEPKHAPENSLHSVLLNKTAISKLKKLQDLYICTWADEVNRTPDFNQLSWFPSLFRWFFAIWARTPMKPWAPLSLAMLYESGNSEAAPVVHRISQLGTSQFWDSRAWFASDLACDDGFSMIFLLRVMIPGCAEFVELFFRRCWEGSWIMVLPVRWHQRALFRCAVIRTPKPKSSSKGNLEFAISRWYLGKFHRIFWLTSPGQGWFW